MPTGYETDDKMRDLDIAQMVNTTPLLTRLLFRLHGRRFNRVASRVVLRAYERGVINSAQMHLLCSQFDPTQNGVVGRM